MELQDIPIKVVTYSKLNMDNNNNKRHLRSRSRKLLDLKCLLLFCAGIKLYKIKDIKIRNSTSSMYEGRVRCIYSSRIGNNNPNKQLFFRRLLCLFRSMRLVNSLKTDLSRLLLELTSNS